MNFNFGRITYRNVKKDCMPHSKLGNCFKLKLSIIVSYLEEFQIVFDMRQTSKNFCRFPSGKFQISFFELFGDE